MVDKHVSPEFIDLADLRKRFVDIMKVKCYSVKRIAKEAELSTLTVTRFVRGYSVQIESMFKIARLLDKLEKNLE